MSQSVTILGPHFSTFVRSVKLCCEEKGITYQSGMTIDGQTLQLGSADLYQYHPFGKVPVLFHQGKRYFETLAICRYLDDNFAEPCLFGQTSERTDVEQWANALAIYVDDILIRRYLLEFAFPKGRDGAVRIDVVNQMEPKVVDTLQLLNRQLTGSDFFKSDRFSVADAILIPMLDYLEKLPHSSRLFKDHSALAAYLRKMKSRDACRAVLL
jgi:glutathione S-transferase